MKRVAISGAALFTAGLAFALAGSSRAEDAAPALVTGNVRISLSDTTLADVAPIVVFLDAVEGRLDFETPEAAPLVRQKNARFRPAFQVVVAGQRVEMANDDAIYHNVFSYSRPNHFDLGVYPAGESRFVKLRHAGVVKTYCSIHESMNGTIFVAPSPYFAVVSPTGEFAIRGVPPGEYRLGSWSEKLPLESRVIALAPAQQLPVAVELGR